MKIVQYGESSKVQIFTDNHNIIKIILSNQKKIFFYALGFNSRQTNGRISLNKTNKYTMEYD